jgi:hypothetical protein
MKLSSCSLTQTRWHALRLDQPSIDGAKSNVAARHGVAVRNARNAPTAKDVAIPTARSRISASAATLRSARCRRLRVRRLREAFLARELETALATPIRSAFFFAGPCLHHTAVRTAELEDCGARGASEDGHANSIAGHDAGHDARALARPRDVEMV